MRLLPLCVLIPVLLAGCTVPKSAGFPDVKQLLAGRGLRIHWNQGGAEDQQVEARIGELLGRPLTVSTATEIGLLNNPKLQGTYERLGVAQADLVQAGLLRNPSLSLGLSVPITGGVSVTNELEGSLVQDFLDLFMIPLRKRFARIEFESVKLEVADAVLDQAAAVRRAFYAVQSGQQVGAGLRTVVAAAQAAVDLRQRQFDAGNVPEGELIAEKNAYAQAKLDLAHAELELRVSRQGLDRELGVWGGRVAWTIEDGLADIPQQEWPVEHVESFAMSHRLDILAARTRLDSFLAAIKLTNAGLIGGLDVGVQGHQDADVGTRLIGPTLRLELPIFDQRQGTRAKLRAQLRQAQRSLDTMAIRVRTEVREARDRMVATREMVEFFKKTVLPLREREIALTQLQYNAMQVGLFNLLAAKEHQVKSYREYIESLRDYWLARTELERAAGSPLTTPAGDTK